MESPLLLDMAIHQFDQARFVAGVEPVAVSCHEFDPAGSWYEGRASAICTFELAMGRLLLSRVVDGRRVRDVMERVVARHRNRRDCAVGRGGRPVR